MTKLQVEIARTPEQHARGLMGRRHLPENGGMLFDFGKARPLSFWMADTVLPLQLAFLQDDGTVGQIERLKPLDRSPVCSQGPYRYALEVNDGWFDRHGITVRSQMALPGTPQPAPQAAVNHTLKEILRRAADLGRRMLITYISVDGLPLPPKIIDFSAEHEWGKTKEGETEGLLTVWDEQKGRFSSFHVDNITGVFDLQGNPLRSPEQLDLPPSHNAMQSEASATHRNGHWYRRHLRQQATWGTYSLPYLLALVLSVPAGGEAAELEKRHPGQAQAIRQGATWQKALEESGRTPRRPPDAAPAKEEIAGTAHFEAGEFACRCCGKAIVEPALLEALEKFRALCGDRPIVITSGYRCPKHNRAVGGAEKSRHMSGTAADIEVRGMDRDQMYRMADESGLFGGVGKYPGVTAIHVDVRPGHARWQKTP
jgi:uncharacterized membrane protein (UPF0127 family)